MTAPLRELEYKAKAHDDYVRAARAMGRRQQDMRALLDREPDNRFASGFLAAIAEFTAEVIHASAEDKP